MDEIKEYVDILFAHQPKSSDINDLKDEIYDNMTAKMKDLLNQGYSNAEAIKEAKAGITDIEEILGDSKLTAINVFRAQQFQSLLLASVIIWVLSLPALLLGQFLFSVVSFMLIILFGVLYLVYRKKNTEITVLLCKRNYKKLRLICWIIWALFFIVCALSVSMAFFGSNFWFARPIHIDGPYALANILVRYYLPALTIAYPIAIGNFIILLRSERNEKNE